MAQKTATVVVVDDNDSFSEHLEAMQNAYGCSGVMVSPRQQDPITPQRARDHVAGRLVQLGEEAIIPLFSSLRHL